MVPNVIAFRHCSGRNLTRKLAIVTGGDSGLGFATALSLAKRGAKAACISAVGAEPTALIFRSSSATTTKPGGGWLPTTFQR